MARKTIEFSLYIMGLRPQERRNQLAVVAALLGFLAVGAFLSGAAEVYPVPGWIMLYLLLAAVPFIFGLNWSNGVIAEEDKGQIRRHIHPWSNALYWLMSLAVLAAIRTWAAGSRASWALYWQQIAEYLAVFVAADIFVVYVPFLAARAIAQRLGSKEAAE